MLRIVNDTKKGYITTDNLIQIFDCNMYPFYMYDFTGFKKKIFNLPKGIFYTDNNLQPLKRCKKFKLKNMPNKEYLFRSYPERWQIYFSHNPNKCTVNYPLGKIYLDNRYKHCARVIFDFIIFHELGHCFFATEKYADLFAANLMLLKGYNPSQTQIAPLKALSDRSTDRKKFILENFNQNKI